MAILIITKNIVVNILIQLLFTPYLLRQLGQGEYGLYSLVASIIGYFPKSSEEREFKDDEFQYHDNTYIEKEILLNPNLEH